MPIHKVFVPGRDAIGGPSKRKKAEGRGKGQQVGGRRGRLAGESSSDLSYEKCRGITLTGGGEGRKTGDQERYTQDFERMKKNQIFTAN